MNPPAADMGVMHALSGKNGGALQIGRARRPNPGRHDVLVAVKAASLNPHDWKTYEALRPLYRSGLPLPPLRIGHDLAGTVIEVGPAATDFRVGDAVYAMSLKPGAFAEIARLRAHMLAPKPEGLSWAEAAALPMVGLTALQAFRRYGLRDGERVLVIGGSGGVGSVAVQLAKARGCHVTAVCSTRNVALVRGLGADAVIDYRREDVTARDDLCFDLIFDTIGEASVASCRRILAPRGARFISTRTSAGFVAQSLLSRLPHRGPTSGTLLALPLGRDLRELNALIDAGRLRPLVDRVFPLRDLAHAIAYSQTGRAVGKIVLAVEGRT